MAHAATLLFFILNVAPNEPPTVCERRVSDSVPIDVLSQPISFPIATNVSARNRIFKAPMTELMATYDRDDPNTRGLPTDSLMNLYKKWNDGGAAVIVTGSTMISPDDLEGDGNLIIAKEIDSPLRRLLFKKLTATVGSDALFVVQLLHPGRMAMKFREGYKPIDMNEASLWHIEDIVERYAYAALFAKESGFNGVELNVGVDFAMAQLVTAKNNQRTDHYGGSLRNRTNIIFEVVDAIRNRVNDDESFVVGLKINSHNFESKYNDHEFTQFCKRLDAAKLDYVVLTGASYDSIGRRKAMAKTGMAESDAFFVNFVTKMRDNVRRAKRILCGGLRTATQMREAVDEQWADAVALGRPMAAETDLPGRILSGEVMRAKKSLLDGLGHGLSEYAAGTQMWQEANNKRVMDLTNVTQVERFKKLIREQKANKTPSSGWFTFPRLVL